MNTEQELRPCPFCACEAVLHDTLRVDNQLVRCSNCGACTDIGTIEEVVRAWNTRSPDEQAEVVGWQPIETATKDHKAPDIILFARWADQGCGYIEDIRIGRWVSGAGPNASLEGWESDEGIHADGYFSFWMPLPTPPSRGEGE